MKCPNCGKEMIDRGRYVPYLLPIQEDIEYGFGWHEDFRCWNCRIFYETPGYNEDGWRIPKKYKRATEKQIKAVEFINKQLGLNEIPVLRKQCWEFINKYYETAKSKNQQRKYK